VVQEIGARPTWALKTPIRIERIEREKIGFLLCVSPARAEKDRAIHGGAFCGLDLENPHHPPRGSPGSKTIHGRGVNPASGQRSDRGIGQEAAVHRNHDAGDEGGIVRGQEGESAAQFPG